MKRLITILTLALLTISMSAQTVKDLQKQQQQIQAQIKQTNQLLQQTKKNETATVNKLTLLNKNIADRKTKS